MLLGHELLGLLLLSFSLSALLHNLNLLDLLLRFFVDFFQDRKGFRRLESRLEHRPVPLDLLQPLLALVQPLLRVLPAVLPRIL